VFSKVFVKNNCRLPLYVAIRFLGGENFHWFEGKRFGFFKTDFGNASEDFTQSFSCE
jgi:hypothetical protein